MKRKAYGRDFGLTSRMTLTMFTLGLLYVVFFVVLVNVLNVGIFLVVLIMGATRVPPVLHVGQDRAEGFRREGRRTGRGA